MNTYHYYSIEEAQQFSFYRLPKVLFTHKEFYSLSTDAKLLYGMMLDRLSLSFKNEWVDTNNHAYIYFTAEKAKDLLHCSLRKSKDLFIELEKIGLIERKKQGFGKPAKIYVMNFIHDNKVETQNNSFDYYTLEETQQFSFYRIPVVLFEDTRYQSLTTDAKLLFGFLLDRLQLSVKHQWVDRENHAYIYFKQEEIGKILDCSEKKVRNLFVELEKACLIIRKKNGFAKPTALYVLNFIKKDTHETIPDISAPMEEHQTGQFCTNEQIQQNTISSELNLINTEKPYTNKDNSYNTLKSDNHHTGYFCTTRPDISAPIDQSFLHHQTSHFCTYIPENSALIDQKNLHPKHTNSFSYIEFSHTEQQPKQSEPEPPDNVVVEKLLSFIAEPLTQKEYELLYSTANKDISLIQEKYELMKSQNVHNIMGFLLTAIKKDFQPPKPHTKIQKNRFVNYTQRDWDFQELEKKQRALLHSQDSQSPIRLEQIEPTKTMLKDKIQYTDLIKQYPFAKEYIDNLLEFFSKILCANDGCLFIENKVYRTDYMEQIEQNLSYSILESLIAQGLHKDSDTIYHELYDLFSKQKTK